MKVSFEKWLNKSWQHGSVKIILPNQTSIVLGEALPGGMPVIMIKTWKALFQLCSHNPSLAFGELYVSGDIILSDVREVLQILVKSDMHFDNNQSRWTKLLGNVGVSVQKMLKKNTLKQNKKNIEDHYDLSNDFYALFLDQGMAYSSGLYLNDEDDLGQAQTNKLERIMSRVAGAESVLEIGCGWGGVQRLCEAQGIQYKGLTLSTEQAKYCNLNSSHGDIALQDYRHETGQYDAIVSIEMIEAVGEEYLPSYFRTLKQCLKPNGCIMLQAIIIQDEYYDGYRKTLDFVNKHIFPGGFLPCDKVIKAFAKQVGLKVTDALSFGKCYAKTLNAWEDRFLERLEDVKKYGFDERFIRKWQYYLAYCATGFNDGRINVVQYELQHDALRVDPI